MNILSFDIEEWYLEKVLHGGRSHKMLQFETTLNDVLEELDRKGIKGTFFCLGKMASEYPDVIRRIIQNGHEIGCHSDSHTFLTSLNSNDLRQDTLDAVHALEDVCGNRISSYRAPAFSITPANAWAIEVLAECGIEKDASIFPASHDYGGFPGFSSDYPCRISYKGVVLKEFPIPMMSFVGRHFAFSGGGYFRLLPYRFIKKEMKSRDYTICYFHLADLIAEQRKSVSREQYEEYYHEKPTLKNRVMRGLKSNIGLKGAFNKFVTLVNDFSFVPIQDADRLIDWEKTAFVEVSNNNSVSST